MIEIYWVCRHQEPFQRLITLLELLLEFKVIIEILDWGWCLWWHFGLSPYGLKASRTPSRINNISRIIAGVDDEFDVPYWGWCPWWQFAWSTNYLSRVLHFEFWSGRYNTNIQKFLPKNPSRYQYDRKNFQKFFNPIPIRESFLGQKSTWYQYDMKKISWKTNTTPIR